jgi:hypothetical protein
MTFLVERLAELRHLDHLRTLAPRVDSHGQL